MGADVFETANLQGCNRRGRGQTILVVDDDSLSRKIIGLMLIRMNYQVADVACGEDAVAFISKQPVGLVTLDMNMHPGMDGCQTFAHITQIRPQQKAIIISGNISAIEIQKAHALGIEHILTKPCTFRQLAAAVKAELAQTGTSLK